MNLIKNYKLHLILLIGTLLGTDFDKIFKTATLENSYKNKVEFAVSRTVDIGLFELQVSVTVVDNAEYKEYLTIQSKNKLEEEKNTTIEEEKSEDSKSSTGLLPGLPSIPTAAIDEKGLAVDINQMSDEDSKFKGIPSQYHIDKIEVLVRLDESVSSPNIKQEITTTIRSVIPGLEDCFDCVDYEVKDFLAQTLRNQINKFSEDQILLKEELGNKFKNAEESQNSFKEILNNKFDEFNLTNENDKIDLEERFNVLSNSRAQEISDLQLSLEESLNQIATDVREKLEDDMSTRDRKSNFSDSIMWSEFINRENNYQKRQDSMMLDLTQKRLETEEKYAQDILKFAEAQLERVMSKDGTDTFNPAYDRADLGMQKIGTKGILEFMPWIIVGLFGLLLLFSIFKRPKPIYLKPKPIDSDKAKSKPEALMVEKQTFTEDNDVIRSDVKKIRRAAVSESIREKEGAVDIISSWLDDENEVVEQKTEDKKEEKDSAKDEKDTKKKDKKKKK